MIILPAQLDGGTAEIYGNGEITANFSVRTYTLSVITNPLGGGRAAGVVGGELRYVSGNTATLSVTACPADYEFVRWNRLSGALTFPGNASTSTAQQVQVTLGAPDGAGWVVEAEFRKTYSGPLGAITVGAAAGGYVVANGGTIAGGSNDTLTGEIGQPLDLQARASNTSEYKFAGWEGALSGSNASASITFASAAQTVRALFQPQDISFTVKASPTAGGVLTAQSGALSAATNGTATRSFPFNSNLSLTASANAGYDFYKFEVVPSSLLPNLSTSGNTATFVHTKASTTVTAKFNKRSDLNQLTVTSNAGGSVMVSGSYNTYTDTGLPLADNPVIAKSMTVAAGTSEQENFAFNTQVRLVAVPATNYVFDGWTSSENLGNSATATIALTGNKAVTAKFRRTGYSFTSEVWPQDAFDAGARVKVAGSVQPTRISEIPWNIGAGTNVQVEATPQSAGRWQFKRFEKIDGSSDNNPNTQTNINIIDHQYIKAVYAAKPLVSITKSPSEAVGKAYVENDGTTQKEYDTNGNATIYAEKTSDEWHFVNFTITKAGVATTVSGAPDGNRKWRHQFTVTGDVQVVANFERSVRGTLFLKDISNNPNSETDINGTQNDAQNTRGNAQVYGTLVTMKADRQTVSLQAGGPIELGATGTLEQDNSNRWRFVRWRIQNVSTGAWYQSESPTLNYLVPSDATELRFFACYTDKRSVQAAVQLNGTPLSTSQASAFGIEVKYNSATLAVGASNPLSYAGCYGSPSYASLKAEVCAPSPAPAAPAPAGARAAGAPRSAAAPAAAPASAPAAAPAGAPAPAPTSADLIFIGWTVTGNSMGEANTVNNPSSPDTALSVKADGSVTAQYKTRSTLNVGIKTVPEGGGLTLSLISGTNTTTGQTLAMGGGTTVTFTTIGNNDSVTLTARESATVGSVIYRFAGWDRNGNGVLDAGERTGPVLNVDTSLTENTLTAIYERARTLALDVTPEGAGTIQANGSAVTVPGTFEFSHGTPVTLSASPVTGKRFVKWSGSGTAGLANPATYSTNSLTLDADYALVAEFEAAPNDLTVYARINGASAEPDPSTGLAIDANGTQLLSGQSKTYYYFDTAKITALTGAGGSYVFDRWETEAYRSAVKDAPNGAVSTTANPGYVSMEGAQSVTAHYKSVHQINLTVTTQGGGTGGVVTLDRTSELPRAESGNTYTYYYNDAYGLTASAVAGYRFLHWVIDDNSGNPATTSTSGRVAGSIRSNLNITAVFAKEYTLTFTVFPLGADRTGGTVSKPVAGTTLATYTAYHGQRIDQIEASPNVPYGFRFLNWTTDAAALDFGGLPVNGSDASTTSLVVAGPHTLLANFTQAGSEIKIITQIVVDEVEDTAKTTGLRVFVNGSTVPGAEAGSALAHLDEKLYYIGDHATLDATVPLALQDTYVFMAWEQEVGGAANPMRDFNPLPSTKIVRAYYRTKAQLTMAISPAGIGTTTPSVGVHPSGADSERDYYINKVIPLISTDLRQDTIDLYAFTGWTTDGGAGPQNPDSTNTSVTLDVREKALTANYVAGHKLEVKVKYESESNASLPVQYTTVAGSRNGIASGGGNYAGIYQTGPQVMNYAVRTIANGQGAEIHAGAAVGYRFVGWIQNEGDTPSGGPVLMVPAMYAAQTYTAVFERIRVQLRVHTIPGDVPEVKAEAITAAKLISGEGAEPRVYEVFYGQASTLEWFNTSPNFYFSRWIRGASYTELGVGETAITSKTYNTGALVASVTDVTAVFAAGGGYRTLFLFADPEANVDIQHVKAPGAASNTYTTMSFPDGKTRPVCIAYVAVDMIAPYTNIDIHADKMAVNMNGDHFAENGPYEFLRWKPEIYNFDVVAAGSFVRDLYENDTYIKHPRSEEIVHGSLYYTAIYTPPGGSYYITLRLELATDENGETVEIDPDYKDDFKVVTGFNDMLGSINGSTMDGFTGKPILSVNRTIRSKRAILQGAHDESFAADEEFKASPFSIQRWTFERPEGHVIGQVDGESGNFQVNGPAPSPSPAPAAGARAAAAPAAGAPAPAAGTPWGAPPGWTGGAGWWGWWNGAWGYWPKSPAGTSYGIKSGETGEPERVTAYVNMTWVKISMTEPVFSQPETWTTKPVVADPGSFSFLRYDTTGVPEDIFYAKNVTPAPAPYVKQSMRVYQGSSPVLNITSVPANYRHLGWSLDGSTTAAFAGSGFSWASWPSAWPRQVEDDTDVTPVYIRRMQATAVLKVSDEAVANFGNNFNDKVDFMYVGTLDKQTPSLSSVYDYKGGIQVVATPDAAQFHVLRKWIIEKATADGGLVFDPADTQEVIVESDAPQTLNITVDYPVRVTAVFGFKTFNITAEAGNSVDGNKHGKVTIDGQPAGGDLSVTATSFYSNIHAITALPDAGYAFVGWTVSPGSLSKPASSAEAETTINVDGEKTVTARFERMVTLTMKTTPAELMVPAYAHLTTPATGVHSTLDGKQLVDTSAVTIVAGTDGDYDFLDWTIEDDNGSRNAAGSNQNLTLLGNTTATAHYKRLHEITLSVEPAPFAEESAATITPSYGSVLKVVANGVATGAKKYREDATLTLTAQPGTHFNFKHWEISVNEGPVEVVATASHTLTVTAPASVKAVYEPKNYTITVGYASSDMAPPGVNPPMAATLTATYNLGSEVTRNLLTEGNTVTLPYGTDISLATSPALYYAFYDWTGGIPSVSTAQPLTFKVDGDRTVTANFKRSQYLLTTAVLPDAASGSLAILEGTRNGNPSVHAIGEVIKLGVVDTDTTIFQKWENNSTARERAVTMSQDHSLTATFAKAVRIKAGSDNARGTVTIEGARKIEGDYYVFAEGDPVVVTATPATHYEFYQWQYAPAAPADASSAGTSGGGATLTFTARDSVDITALFTEKNYSIKVTAQPEAGAASLTGTNPSHDFLAVNTTSRLYGTAAMTVTVTPKDEPGARYAFVDWDGISSLTTPSRVWNCDGDVVWVARLKQQAKVVVTEPINITASDAGVPGGGTVLVGPGEYRIDVGQNLVITPTPAAGFEFAEWRGLPASGATVEFSTDKLTLSINAGNASEDIVLTPCFRKKSYTVTTGQWDQKTGAETIGGSLSVSPAPTVAGVKYTDGTSVTVKVDSVYTNFRFVGWDTDNDPSHTVDVPANASREHTFTVAANTTIYAVFTQVFKLSLSAEPSDAGTVAIVSATNESGVVIDAALGLYEFERDTVVTVKATPTRELAFIDWVGSVSSVTSPETTVTMSGDRSVTARFGTTVFHNLVINVNPAGHGTVSATGESSFISDARTISRRENTDVVLVAAVTEPGYVFAGWSGDASGSATGTLVRIDGDKTVTANFEPAIYTVTARPVVPGTGTVSGVPGGSASYGY
ncbi:MAG: InlB B-repeat-containing protein, partial [Opitutaceae bacterium]|nr:InlB B-repeat-containing protein [Opitutaceae bacterium]